MRKLLFFVFSLVLLGCGPTYIMLVNPKTGDLKRCSGLEVGGLKTLSLQRAVESCASQFEILGYIRVENLTPEQRANLGIAVPKQ